VSGSAQASQLYAPYGSLRYSQGTMPTDYGFTGQRSDATTGLQYFGSRFYDPSAGQFVSADTTLPGNGLDPLGLSRYAYVEGNPVARTDPSGHYMDDGSGGRAFQNYNTGAITYYPVHTAPVYIPPPPARRNSPHVPSIPPSPCQRMPWLCVNAQPSQEAASRPVPRVSVLGCGSTGLVCLSWGRGDNSSGRTGSGRLKGLLAMLGIGSGDTCEANPDACQTAAERLPRNLAEKLSLDEAQA
jgi:RHS repeat-associated protein